MPSRSTAFVLLLVAVACDDTDAPQASEGECRSGDTMACELASGCDAERRCQGEPGEWDRCRCTEAREPDAGPGALPRLGASCDDDDGCPLGAYCLRPQDADNFFGGGPAAAVCVADCTDDTRACDAFEDAACVNVSARVDADDSDQDAGVESTSALCFERCTVGTDPEHKCHARNDVACEAVDESRPQEGFCRPLCATDEACSDGRSCDLRTGACVDRAPIDQASFGQRCEADAGAAGTCDALCVGLGDGYASCGQRCIFGQPGDCAPLPSAAPRGGCLYTAPEGTIGDVGFCAELCDCEVDCSNPDAVCDPLNDSELIRVFGRNGVCTAPELALGESLSCD